MRISIKVPCSCTLVCCSTPDRPVWYRGARLMDGCDLVVRHTVSCNPLPASFKHLQTSVSSLTCRMTGIFCTCSSSDSVKISLVGKQATQRTFSNSCFLDFKCLETAFSVTLLTSKQNTLATYSQVNGGQAPAPTWEFWTGIQPSQISMNLVIPLIPDPCLCVH